MTHAEQAVQLLQRAIAASPAVDPAFKAAMDQAQRIKFLEGSIRDFCEFMVDYGMEGMGDKFHARFRDLCESVGFDADEYDRAGFDREDV